MERIDEKDLLYYYLKDDGTFPNNAQLPVLFFKQVIPQKFFDGPKEIKALLKVNQWEGAWHDTIYAYPHYHSTAHEVLVAVEGKIRLQLGGAQGVVVDFEKGDVVVIPAGVAHQNLDPENAFSCVGAYPRGQSYDLNHGLASEREDTDRNIERVPLPVSDPLFGEEGPLMKYWSALRPQAGE